MKVSARGGVSPFIVMDVMRAANERAAAGEQVLHLEVGQPGVAAPRAAREAAARAAMDDRLGYTDALGVPALRQAIAQRMTRLYGADIEPGRVAVAGGSSAAFILSFLSAFDAGDRVALASPGYPAYRNILSALGLETVSIPTGPETAFQPTPAQLDALGRKPDGLIVASPANPTGGMLTPEDLETLCRWCDANGVRLISDEIYHGLVFPGGAEQASAAQFSDSAIVVNSLSKYYAMTGWRIGWAIAPADLIRPMERLGQNLFISASAIGQAAAIAAIEQGGDEAQAHVARYERNRDVLLAALEGARIQPLVRPDGAFYLYCDIAAMGEDSLAVSRRMLAEIGVAATPGVDFDVERGGQTLRFSFCEDAETIAEGARRLRDWAKA